MSIIVTNAHRVCTCESPIFDTFYTASVPEGVYAPGQTFDFTDVTKHDRCTTCFGLAPSTPLSDLPLSSPNACS